jgi:hypothetical protein
MTVHIRLGTRAAPPPLPSERGSRRRWRSTALAMAQWINWSTLRVNLSPATMGGSSLQAAFAEADKEPKDAQSK